MAQQTIQFAPGATLQDWAPGFTTSGSPIQGIRIDNTSGSWLGVRTPSLPIQYVPPYTLNWCMTCLVPLQTLTITSGGPPGSISTTGGDPVSVYAYDEPIGDSFGTTYYTPSSEPQITSTTSSIVVGPGVLLAGNPLVTPVPSRSIRLYNIMVSGRNSPASGDVKSFLIGAITDTNGSVVADWVISPIAPSIQREIPITLDPGLGLEFEVANTSTLYTHAINVGCIYGMV